MKAFKLCENAQLKNLSSTECNNNGTSNGKSANSYVKSAVDGKNNGDILSDKSKVFKQRMSSSTTLSTSNHNSDDRMANSAVTSSKKACSIENFLSSSVPSAAAAATVETARNGFLAAAAAAQQYTQFNLFTPYLKDMFFAAQLLRGNTSKTNEKKRKRNQIHLNAKAIRHF